VLHRHFLGRFHSRKRWSWCLINANSPTEHSVKDIQYTLILLDNLRFILAERVVRIKIIIVIVVIVVICIR